jgi:hypothetical protein
MLMVDDAIGAARALPTDDVMLLGHVELDPEARVRCGPTTRTYRAIHSKIRRLSNVVVGPQST